MHLPGSWIYCMTSTSILTLNYLNWLASSFITRPNLSHYLLSELYNLCIHYSTLEKIIMFSKNTLLWSESCGYLTYTDLYCARVNMMTQIKHWRYTSETKLDMTDMASMVGGLNLEGGFDLTGDVEVNKLTSQQRPERRILRRTAELCLFPPQTVQEMRLNPAERGRQNACVGGG